MKGAAAAAPSPSAISDGDDDGDDDDNEEEEEASSGDGAGQEAAGSEEEADPEAQAGVAADVASAASEPPAAPVQPKRVRFLARGASKAIDQSEVDPSSLSGEKGSFVFYGRYCGPGARFVFFFVEGREGCVLVSERKVRSLPSRGSKGERKGGGGRKVRVETKKGVESDTFLFFSLCNLTLRRRKKKKKTGWTDKQNRPGIDPVDEACHAHDTCYGQAREANPPSHKVRRAAAECACDRALVSALKDFKKNKQQQAAASKAAKRAAGDMEKLFDVKCPLAVAGAVLRPPSPSPESAPGGN